MEKTYVFDGATSSNDALLMSALNGGGFGGNFNNPFWAIILLAFLRNNFGWNGNESGVDRGFVASQLGQAVAGNGNALSNLSTHLDCSIGQVQSAIAAVQSAICGVGNQLGMGTAQVINAINAGDAGIISTLQSCCCDVKNLVTTQGYENRINNLQQSQLIQNGFSQIGYANAENTCAIKQNATDNTNRVIAKLDAIEDGRKDREIATLTAQLTAANSRAERQAELAPILKQLNDIACKQPQTYNVPYQPFTAIPNCVAFNAFGLNPFGFGYNNGQWS